VRLPSWRAALLTILFAAPAGAYLSQVDVLESPAGEPNGIAMSPDGAHIYGTVLFREFVIALRRDPVTGGVTPIQAAPGLDGLSVSGPYLISMPPDGGHVYVSAANAPATVVYRRDPATGLVTLVERAEGLAGAVAFTPDGLTGYTNGAAGVVRLVRDPASGHLSPTADPPAAGNLLGLSADGTTAYTTDLGTRGEEVVAWARDGASGALSRLAAYSLPDLEWVDPVAVQTATVSPDGGTLYVGFYGSAHPLVVLRLVRAEGRLDVAQRPSGVPGLFGAPLVLGPDGSILYAAASVLRRDTLTGTLSAVERMIGGGVTAVSPDGRDVYTSNFSDLVHLRRSCGDGVVDPNEACDDGGLANGDGCSDVCTVEPCWTCPAGGVCVPTDGLPCDDANACTSGETCVAGACVVGTVVADGTACDDGDACTSNDACAAGACVPGARRSCPVCEACDHDVGCVGVATRTCTLARIDGPAGGTFLGRDRPRGAAFHWAFVRESMPPSDDYPDPRTTDYTLCVFDQRDLVGSDSRKRSAILGVTIPADPACDGGGACWTVRSRGGFTYRDPGRSVTGIAHVDLLPARRHGASIRLRGRIRGERAPVLPLELPARVELRAGDQCWAADYDLFIVENDHRRFQAFGGECPPSGCSAGGD
jgi:cysteine-rich repeat protein